MKSILLFLLCIPTLLFSQTNSGTITQASQSTSFFQTEFIKIGKVPIGALNRMEVTVEIKTNLTNSTKSDSVNLTFPNPYISLIIDGNDIDTVISVAAKMLGKANTSPANNVQILYRCNNGFELKFNWDSSNWVLYIDSFYAANTTIAIPATDIPAFISSLRQAKSKFQ
jgi:hypothetical protein